MDVTQREKKKQWGGRTEWSKAFFTMIPPRAQEPSLPEHEHAAPAGTVTLKPKKQRKKDELDPATRWQCTRCGQFVHPPLDSHTQRPALVVLADHLEGLRVVRGASTASAVQNMPLCAAPSGFLQYNGGGASVEAQEGVGAAGQGEVSSVACPRKRSREDSQSKAAADAERCRAQLEALLFPCTEPSLAHTLGTSVSASSPVSTSDPSDIASPAPSARVFVVIENPKTPRNYGSILRAMHNYGCDVPCGDGHHSLASQTAAADDDDVEVLSRRFSTGGLLYSGTRLNKALLFASAEALATDTVDGAHQLPSLALPSLQVLFDVLASHAKSCVSSSTENGGCAQARTCSQCAVVAVDLIEGAMCLPFFEHPFSATPSAHRVTPAASHVHVPLVFYLFGPEDGTLSECFLRQCNAAVFMPTIASMNLAASVNVLLYDRVAKQCLMAEQKEQTGGSATSRYSRVFETRNANNQLRWCADSETQDDDETQSH